jgi:hypothetical protein
MAEKKFLVDINLDLNQLVNARIQNGTGFVSGGAGSIGRFVYDTSDARIKYDTGSALLTVATLNDVAGLLDFKGGYDASSNTPNLTTPTTGAVLKGDFYVVTTAGTFFGVALEVGDSLIAEIDNPSALTDWVILQGNVVYASETVAGVIEIATQVETNTGTDDLTAITPLKLTTYIGNQGFTKKFATSGNISTTPLVVTHNLNTTAVQVSIYEQSTNNEIEAQITATGVNTVTIVGNNAVAIASNINVIG